MGGYSHKKLLLQKGNRNVTQCPQLLVFCIKVRNFRNKKSVSIQFRSALDLTNVMQGST